MLAREPCAGCGAPLGADQRYCLSCGIPRAGTRLPFLDVLHAEAASAGAYEMSTHPPQPAALLRMPALAGTATSSGSVPRWGGEEGIAARLRENTGLFALLGVLLVALLIGLLLGHWVSGGAKSVASVPAKQVIEVKGLPAATVAPAAAPTTAASAPGSTDSSGASSPSKEASSTTLAKHASNPAVSSLARSTGKEHAKEVEKALSKGGGSLSTGGAPPPKENSKPGGSSKPIGGGSEVASIE